MKLTAYSEAIHRHEKGNQLQRLELIVIYNPEEDIVDEIVSASLSINNNHIADISTLLDKCEGFPLEAIIQAFPWREIYRSQKTT